MNDEVKEEQLLRLRTLGERLDESINIPGTNYKIGLDPIIGAIPIIGDLIGGILSTYILYSGMKMGASPKIIAQMATNIAIEFIVGSLPILGDIFDIIWKANIKNIELIEDSIDIDDNENNVVNYLIIATLIITLIGTILIILRVLS